MTPHFVCGLLVIKPRQEHEDWSSSDGWWRMRTCSPDKQDALPHQTGFTRRPSSATVVVGTPPDPSNGSTLGITAGGMGGVCWQRCLDAAYTDTWASGFTPRNRPSCVLVHVCDISTRYTIHYDQINRQKTPEAHRSKHAPNIMH